MTTDNETVEESHEEDVEQAPGLSMQDLNLALGLINTAIRRGTYKPNELVAVGQIYERIEKFLHHQAQKQTNDAEGETE